MMTNPPTMYRIFNDPDLHAQFLESGFVVLDLLSEAGAAELGEYYLKYDRLPEAGGFYATMFHPEPESKAAINRHLCEVIGGTIRKYAPEYRPLFGNFIVKAAHNTHVVGIHQDWTYVDERKYRSFNVWTSLGHSGPHNGGMYVLPGSHLVDMPIRWTPFDCEIYNTYREAIMENSVGLELGPGQAVVYDSALIHYSMVNDTDRMRLACGCVFVPQQAEPVHYYRQGDDLLVFDAGGGIL